MKMKFEILKDRPKIKVRLTRDSVCAGDDCDAPHELSVEMNSFTDPLAFINHLSSGYLPSIAGIGHTWDCLMNGQCIGSISSNGFKSRVREITYSSDNCVHFRYHSATY